jgi:hypothetical protein
MTAADRRHLPHRVYSIQAINRAHHNKIRLAHHPSPVENRSTTWQLTIGHVKGHVVPTGFNGPKLQDFLLKML